MTGNLGWLSLAAAFLLASHFGIASTGARAALVGRIGERGYRALFSIVATVALVWLVMAYNAAPYQPVWFPSAWMWFVPLFAMPLAFLLLVGGLSSPNPTAVGQGAVLEKELGPRGVLRITRNPVMWGFGLWAVAHMVPNGDWASLLFFGTLAVLALLGAILIDAKNAVRRGLTWERWTELSSNVPFAAIIQGRQSLPIAIREIGWIRLVVALALYAGLLHGHAWLFGVSPLPPL
ncbi:NnrU protein [Skermanella stibiiresistens SB22]|uniref:NnrU protein n=1 Tax=Skermanella stibiiresistens SB22 TaxID=1385369 RepID=W9GVV3_9PROT|nr:NnrU family protein [Skermanella stibiiresistens]EWY37939.1 NnrU protein [Skermanella stibiiresistens SB22]